MPSDERRGSLGVGYRSLSAGAAAGRVACLVRHGAHAALPVLQVTLSRDAVVSERRDFNWDGAIRRILGCRSLRWGRAAMQAEPFSGVTVPLHVEDVATDLIEAGEGGIELFAEILREA